MTPKQTKEAAAVMLAWAEGKDIQYRIATKNSAWVPLTTPRPSWGWSCYTYRIKPNTIKYRRWIMPVSYTHLTLPTNREV